MIRLSACVFCAVTSLVVDVRPAAADLPADVQAAKQKLAAVSTRVAQKTASFVCSSADCPLRLFVARSFLESTTRALLEGRTVTFRMTGKTGYVASSGGGGFGCGWFVEIDDNTLGANLAIGAVSPRWVPTRGLELDPRFVFDTWAQIHGHVKGAAGFCSIFHVSCDCPLGGGTGTSAGMNARLENAWPLALDFRAEPSGPVVSFRQTRDMILRTTVQVGLQHIGTLGIPVEFRFGAQSLSTFPVPTLIGFDGELTLPAIGGGQPKVKKYSLSFASPSLVPSDLGLVYQTALRTTFQP